MVRMQEESWTEKAVAIENPIDGDFNNGKCFLGS